MDISQLIANLSGAFNGELDKTLENLDESTLAPVALLLNVKPHTLVVIVRIIPKLINGEIDFKTVIPSVFPAIVKYFLSLYAAGATENSAVGETPTAENKETVEILKNVAGNNFDAYELYLQSESASL